MLSELQLQEIAARYLGYRLQHGPLYENDPNDRALGDLARQVGIPTIEIKAIFVRLKQGDYRRHDDRIIALSVLGHQQGIALRTWRRSKKSRARFCPEVKDEERSEIGTHAKRSGIPFDDLIQLYGQLKSKAYTALTR